MKLYTKTGDEGYTSLYSGERVSKSYVRVDAYGTVDELQANIGLARAIVSHREIAATLKSIEELLVEVMADLSTINGVPRITKKEVEETESVIDHYSSMISMDSGFVLPGESQGAATLHMARTIARRCERILVALSETDEVSPDLLMLINRLSDLLFVLSQVENNTSKEQGA